MQDYGFGLPLMSPFQGFPPYVPELPKPHKRTNSTDKASEEESFQPEYHHLKKLGLKVNKKKIQTGGWSAQQNQVYLRFMMDNINDFITEKSRRTSKVFYRLSKILKRRTPDQCRSHHQKLQMKYQDDLKGIMEEVYKKIQRSIAQEIVNEQHRLFRPNFMFYREPNKAEPKEPKNSVHQPEQRKESLNSDWFSLDVKSGCIKVEIKTERIKEWTIQ